MEPVNVHMFALQRDKLKSPDSPGCSGFRVSTLKTVNFPPRLHFGLKKDRQESW